MPKFAVPFSNQHPFLLAPVQVQVKFVQHPRAFLDANKTRAEHELLVRIYPDVISVSTHEEELTDSERVAGQTYWQQAGQAPDRQSGQLHSLLAWGSLVEKYGALRGYWIVKQTTPTNLASLQSAATSGATHLPAPQFAPAAGNKPSWGQPARALNLPDRFVVTLYNQIKSVSKTGDPAHINDTLFQDLLMSRPEAVNGYPENVTEMTAEFLEVVRSVEGLPIKQKPLPVGPHPLAGAPGGPAEDLSGEKGLSGNLAWMADFEVALQQGLALAIPLTSTEEIEHGFKRLIVLGVQNESEPDKNARLIEALFSDQAYTQGFELVPQGTPTNNTGGQGAGYSSADVYDAEASFKQFLQQPLFQEVGPGERDAYADGQHLAEALGIKAATLQHVRYSDAADGREAMLLNRALWPATFGYFLDTALYPLFSADRGPVEQTRRFFEDYVSGRGGVPAIRVGNEPYGILTTTQYSAFEAPRSLNDKVPDFGTNLWSILRRLDVTWTERLSRFVAYPTNRYEVPFSVMPPGQQDIMTVLGQDATSVEAYQRYMVGPAVMDTLVRDAASRGVNLWPQVQNVNNNGIPVSAGQRSNTNGRFGTPANPLNPLYMEFRELFDPTGFFGLNDRPWPWMFDLAMQSNFRKVVHNFADEPRPEWMGAPGPMIDGLPFSETEPVLPFPKKDFNFIGWLAAASFDQIRLENFRELYDNEVPEEFTPPTSLLYRLLRHAVLLQFWDAALQTYEAAGQPLSREEKELFNILSPDIARWDLLYRPSPLTGNQPLYQELQEAQGPGGEALDAYRKQVAALADLPTAHLERALAEHLDLGTYRLDAWKTAFVQYRLTELRKDRPTGSFIGAFGWLEDVTPQDKSVPVNGAYEDPDNLGYIHAPTINHATAAAVLRQGYKSRQFSTDSEDPAANRMAVNLSSERVRRAQATLESIRTGQSLGSVLGQYFERALRDAIVPTLSSGKPYASLIPDYRRAFPYAGEKTTLGQPAPDPAIGSEQAERQVVDGLALLEQAKLTSYYPLIPGIPRVNQGDNDFIAFVRQELKALADTVDALGDLTVGESIYQAVVGNMEQAGAMLENVAKGRFPTAPEVVHTPRGGTSVTHRVLLQLPSAENGQPMLEHWGTSSSPRALAEPGLNAWLAPLIGYPEELVFSYQYKVQENVWDNLEISLADAQLQPIDLLFLTEGDALRAGSGLDMYLAQVVRAQHHDQGEDPDGIGEVDFSWPQAAPSNFRRLLPMLARIRQLLGLARAAVPTDLANPSRQAPGQPSPADAGVIFSSVEENLREVRDGLSSLASQLADAADGLKATLPNIPAWQLWDLRVLMQTAVGYGVTEAGPATNPALIDPVGSALAIEQLIQRRLLAAEQLPGEETTAYYVSLAQALLGPAFRLAPSFTLDGDTQDAYAQAMEPDRLESLLKAHADDALLTHEWLQSVAPVREPMDHLEKVTMLHDLLHADESGYQPLRLTPTQLTARPLNPNDSDYWLGVSYPEGYVPPEDAISLVQLLPEQYNAGNPQQAFVLDEWTEIIPAKEEVTSVAFHYDQPNTEAPQTLLLVVSPDSNDEADWRWEALLGAVNETLDLAKKRAIEPDTLAFTHLGMLLPAIIAPVAQQGTTITLDYRLVNGTAAFGNLTFGEEPLYSTFQ